LLSDILTPKKQLEHSTSKVRDPFFRSLLVGFRF
jgi:hypothetical protein